MSGARADRLPPHASVMMSRLYRATFAAALTAATIGCAPAASAPPPAAAPERAVRAEAGDTVYVLQYFVRAERRDQFESFMRDVLWPAAERLGAEDASARRFAQQTRLLSPTRADEDGVLTYVMLLDPVASDAAYSLLAILQRAHGDAEGRQRYWQLTETWAREFTSTPYVQTTR